MGFRDQKGQFRRKFPRRMFQRKVGILHRGEYYVAMAGEIGEGGLSFSLDVALPANTPIVLNLGIPGGDFISIRAEIRSVRASPKGNIHGVAFKNISFSHKRQVRSYVSSRAENESLIL